jgi:hypothetical protein
MIALVTIAGGLMSVSPAKAGAEFPQPLELLCGGAEIGTDFGFPPSLVENEVSIGELADIAVQANNNLSAYFSALEESTPFPGLFLRGQADKSSSDGRSRHSVAIEWELFDHGAGDIRRAATKARLERQISYYQLLRDLDERRLHDDLFRLQQVRTAVSSSVYEREAEFLASIWARRKVALEHGYATKEDVADIEFKYQRADAMRQRTTLGTMRISLQEQVLMNQIGGVVLRPIGELKAHATSRSYEYLLQSAFVARENLAPSWTDDFGLGVYLERSNDFYRSDQTIAGLKVRIPLDSRSSYREAYELERAAYAGQQRAVEIRLGHKIEQLASQIALTQTDLSLLKKEYHLLDSMIDTSCDRSRYPVTDIDVAPDRKLEELQLKKFEKMRDIYTAQLDLLEALFELNSIVKPTTPSELYQLDH